MIRPNIILKYVSVSVKYTLEDGSITNTTPIKLVNGDVLRIDYHIANDGHMHFLSAKSITAREALEAE